MVRTLGKHVLYGGAIGVIALAGIASGAEKPAKIDLKILYAGNPASPRTDDFVKFLQTHFAVVEVGDLAGLKEEQARRFDVVVLDYDTQEPPRPKFTDGYSVPTVTVGAAGALIGNTNGLKTGYL
jgi:hypothetical protein